MDGNKLIKSSKKRPTDKDRARAGFGIAPILYMLGLIGVGAGVLFSSYSQSIKNNINMTNGVAVSNDLSAGAATLAATSVLGGTAEEDNSILCPPTGGAASANCSTAPTKMTDFWQNGTVQMGSLATDHNMPAGVSTAYTGVSPTGGAPVEVGIFAPGAGTKQLDPWGHYYVVCRWENNPGSSNPAFQIISGGPTGVISTPCGSNPPQPSATIPLNYSTTMNAASAVNRASVWQTTMTTVGTGTAAASVAKATYAPGGVSVDSQGNLTVPGLLNVHGDLSSDIGGVSLNSGSLSAVNGTFSGGLTAENSAFTVGALGTISAASGLFTVSSTGAVSAASGAFLGALSAANGVFSVDSSGDLTINNGTSTVFSVASATGNTIVSGTLASIGTVTLGTSTATTASSLTTYGEVNIGTTAQSGSSALPYLSVGTATAGSPPTYPFYVTQAGQVTASSIVDNGALTAGALTASSILDNGTLNVSGIAHIPTISGNTEVTGNLQVDGTFTSNGAVTVGTGTSGFTLGSTIVPVANGGTGANNPAGAMQNLLSGVFNTIPASALINGSVTTTQLANSGVVPGTYNLVTVDAQGLVTVGTSQATNSNGITDGSGDSITAGTGTLTFDAGGTAVGLWNSTGLMVGTSNPTAKDKLDVYGGVAIGTTYAGSIAAPNNGLIVVGNVGIGTSSPQSGSALTVNGTISANTITATTLNGNGGNLTGIGTAQITGVVSPANGGTGTSAFTPGSVVFVGTSGVYYQDNPNFYWNFGSHYLGIGTTAPAVSLDLSNKNDALALPAGTSGQRPANLINGEIRYLSGTGIEAYINNAWTTLLTANGGGGGVTGTGTTNYVARWTSTTTLGTGTLYDNGTQVGIGTASPATPLNVYSNNSNVQIGNIASTYPAIGFAPSLTTNNYSLGGDGGSNTFINTPSGGSIYFRVSNSTQAIMNSSGSFGIGTASPGSTLDVYGNGAHILIGGSGNSGYTGVGFGATMTASNYSLGGDGGSNTFINAPTSGNIYFRVGNNNQAIINSSGNLGLGTTTLQAGAEETVLNTAAGTTYGAYDTVSSAGAGTGIYGAETGASNSGYGVYGADTGTTNTGFGGYFTNSGGGYGLGVGTGGIYLALGTPSNTNYALYNAGGALSWNGNPIASGSGGWTGGIITVPYGGTGVSSLTANGVLIGEGAGNVQVTAAGTTGTLLIGNTGTKPSFSATPSLTNLTLSGVESLTVDTTDYTTTGSQNNVNLGSYSAIRYNGTAAATFTGILAGASGQILFMHNASAYTLTLANQSGSSSAANQIVTGTGASMALPSNTSVSLMYDGTAALWRVTGSSNAAVVAWPLAGAAGDSAGVPDYSWSGNTNTGLYYSSGIGFTVAGNAMGAVTLTGLNNMPIGATTASTGSFTTLSASSATAGYFNATTVTTGYELGGTTILAYPYSDNSSIAIGPSALSTQNSTNEYNIAIGNGALQRETQGQNIAIGYQAGTYATTGSGNIAVGYQSQWNNQTGTLNTSIGSSALYGASGNSNSNNVAVGASALLLDSTGSGNSAVGVLAMRGNTTGADNVAIGSGALYQNQTGSNNVAVGSSALFGNFGNSTSNNTAVGYYALKSDSTGGNNTGLGYNVGATNVTTGTSNILIGTSSTCDVSAGAASNETHICGATSDSIKITGTNTPSTEAVTINGNVTVSGTLTPTGGLPINSIGAATAAQAGINNGSYGIVWNWTGLSTGTGLNLTSNTARTAGSVLALTDTYAFLTSGANVLQLTVNGGGLAGTIPLNITNAGTAVSIYASAGDINLNSGGLELAGTKVFAYPHANADNSSLAVGPGALGHESSNGQQNIAVGNNSMENITSGQNTAIGYDTMMGVCCSAINSGNNTAIGYNVLQGVTTGANANTIVGSGAGQTIGTASYNTIVGALGGYALQTGSSNTIIGYDVASSTITTGTSNILIGTSSAVTTGTAGTNYNLNIGNLLQGDMTNSTALGKEALFLQSTANSVDYLQIAGGASGNPGTVTISGQGTDTNVSIAMTPKGTGVVNINGNLNLTGSCTGCGGSGAQYTMAYFNPANSVSGDSNIKTDSTNDLIVSAGNIAIGTTTVTNPINLFSGAYVSTSGVWTNASDRRIKKNIRPIKYGLDDLMKLQPVAYDMISNNEKQVGFIAQDVLKVVPEVVGVPKNPETEHYGLSYGNLVAVTVKAIQELKALFDIDHKEFAALKAENDKLRADNDTEAAQIKALTARLDAIEQRQH